MACYADATGQNGTLEMPDTLVTDLENDVIFGVYAPGNRIIEDRVMERYGAKRHAVRNAIAALEARGLLVRKPNRGAEVVDFTPDEVDALYDVRIVLETAAAERTPLPSDPRIAAQLDDIARRHEKAVADQDYRAVFWLNQEFHEVQYSCCGNSRLAELIGNHARAAQPIRVVKYDDAAHMQKVVQEHFAIIEAMRGTSHEALVAAVRAHLPASAEAYRALYERRFGSRVKTG
ncbi:DNA-binding transcriptional regulator, GntR family [Cognatiyoonia koreensis]|uniref:DNA-binding transcriptional regulator, GntR family n=1 Tax=Cognatiyoonia koreensis TaxID=364200 RepID=A0A1I0QGT2_9RHOB|nr:GntR family transcriptional regulator [Cognatiyoonia koreensis]SEW26340.1 DNA-binding transcriptional regulator, GntR family [Cognatiyoonia koreensis]